MKADDLREEVMRDVSFFNGILTQVSQHLLQDRKECLPEGFNVLINSALDRLIQLQTNINELYRMAKTGGTGP